jgi:oxygen-independent coproporphyrinogen III oxidase
MTNIQLIQKYNVPGPRYTSYPTAVQFREVDSERAVNELKNELKARFDAEKRRNLSLYFHIPFCYSLCWYCGCTKIITRNSDRGDLYIDYLQREMDQVTDVAGRQQNVVQVHFGGGTPTFLRPDQLQRLGTLIRNRFQLDKRCGIQRRD